MIDKNAYDKAFEVLRSIKNVENAFDNLGFSIEYGTGTLGKEFENMFEVTTDLILIAMGLHVKTHTATVRLKGCNELIDVDVFYSDDEDPEFAITMDDFCYFINYAINNPKLQLLFWTTMTEKNVNNKNTINNMRLDFSVGITQYDFFKQIKD